MKLLVGMVTYGQDKYTRLTLKYLYKYTDIDFDLVVVIGKPNDVATKELLSKYDATIIEHKINYGFPKSLNDIYEYGFIDNDYDGILIIGNDVLVYPGAVDELALMYKKYGWDYITASSSTAGEIVRKFAKARKYFAWGGRLKADDFPVYVEYRPPKLRRIYDVSKFDTIGDTHNLTLFSKRWFDNVGYVDVNFYPAYFEDNDYARRGQLLGMQMYKTSLAKYFHFTSVTIKEDPERKKMNRFYFDRNKDFYAIKWGGVPGEEKFTVPFNGRFYPLNGTVFLRPVFKIDSRIEEPLILDYWRKLYNR